MDLTWQGAHCLADGRLAGKVVRYNDMLVDGKRFVSGPKYWAAFDTATGERIGDRYASEEAAMAAVEQELLDEDLERRIADLDASWWDRTGPGRGG